ERPEENGMAHFLEHLVFKGGEKYANHRAVNETAERMGGVLNAYTSHDLVAFHITVRAESAGEGLDLLTDFVGRPRLAAAELERLPADGDIEAFEPAPGARTDRLTEQRDTNQSHLRMIYRPGIDSSDATARAALTVYSTLLGGSMGSRLFEEIREQRGLCYSV